MRSLRLSYGETLARLGQEQDNIVVFDADLSGSTQTAIFQKQFPHRHFNMGIAECNMVLFASGISRLGYTVFASSFAMFLAGRAWEMVRNSVAHDNLNVKLVATHAGISVGEDGSSHQMIEDISLMKTIPQLHVYSPADYIETQKVIEYAATVKTPMYIRLSRDVSRDIFDENYQFKPFQPVVLTQNTESQFLIITTGLTTGLTKTFLEELASEEQGIIGDHIHIPTIKPLNADSIRESINRYKFIVTFEEHSTIGGLGDTILSELSQITHPPVYKVGIPDQFGRSGSAKDMWKHFQLDNDSMKKRIQEYCQKHIIA